MSLYKQLQQDPVRLLSMRYSIPGGLQDPNKIIQHLLDTGQVSQEQVNNAMQMRNNPVIQQLIGSK